MKKKIVTSVICLAVILVFNFALPRLMPGDTVLMLVGMDEGVVSADEYAFYAEKTGANKPLLQQFGEYLLGVFRGDLGYSYHHKAEVSQLILRRLPATLQLALPAVILSSLIALALGCLMGMKKGRPVENAVTGMQIALDAVPSFLLALLLLALFAFRLGWLPMGALNSLRVPEGGALRDRIWHLILPVGTLVLGSVPPKYLMLCSTVARQREEKYVLYARSRGMGEAKIAFTQILPNICQPFLTMVGMNMGFLLSGSLVIENIFSIKGMGSLMMQAVTARDYPVLQGCLFVSAVMVVLFHLLTDLLCLLLDPKARCKRHEAK